jgi:pSer/pThr/pTyr-binding forkhead associated (FHA) protein
VAIPVPSVSRVHAEIRSEGEHWVIVDLDSTNGTRVNGAPVSATPLRPGDRIRIGEVEVVFES